MYISKSLLYLILLIVLAIVHIIIHIIIFIKLHNLKSNKPFTLSTIKEKGKELLTTLLKPDNSIISGILEFIGTCIKTDEKEDGSANG